MIWEEVLFCIWIIKYKINKKKKENSKLLNEQNIKINEYNNKMY